MFCYKLKLIDALRSECLRAAHPTRYHVSAALAIGRAMGYLVQFHRSTTMKHDWARAARMSLRFAVDDIRAARKLAALTDARR